MTSIEYVRSEKLWRAAKLDVESSGLGEAILENLKNTDPEKVFEVLHDSGTQVTVKEIRHQTITVAQNLLNLGVKKDDNVVVFTMLNLKITPLTFACTVDIESFQAPNIGDPRAQPAILGFTSGSSGMPKIIINSHAIVKQSVYNFWEAKPGSVIMILSEARWCCQVSAIIQPALLGVKRVYSSSPPMEMTGDFVREIIDTHKVEYYFEVPMFFRIVYEAAEHSQDPSTLSSLKFVSIGGESVGEEFEAYFAKVTPHCQLVKCFGMTEVGGVIASSEKASRTNVNGGVLRKGYMVKVIDTNKNSLGPNEIGQVCVKKLAPFLGYLKNQKANEETFIEGGWLNTGDLGIMDSENILHIFTREKYSLRYADGKILMPNVVENIVNKFEGVHSSAIVGVPSADNPQQDCGTVFVVLKSNTNSSCFEQKLKDYLKKQLTQDQLKIVKHLKIVEDLPKTTCFKVDRMTLKRCCDGA